MLYPKNIKIKKERKIKLLGNKLLSFIVMIEEKLNYLIFDRDNFKARIIAKFHV